MGAVRFWPGAPLVTIDWSEVTILIGPFVPDSHIVIEKVLRICCPLEEPEQFMNDRPKVQLLGCEQWKTFPQIEPHLVSKNADRAGSGAVGLLDAGVQNKIKKIKILLHVSNGKM